MVRYWEKRREQEEKEKRELELKELVSQDFDEEATEYDLMKKECHSKQA